MSRNNKKKSKKGLIITIILLIAVLAVAAAYIYKKYLSEDNTISSATEVENEVTNTIVVEEKKLQTFVGNDRPIAVMIDNNINALPHAGLSKAYAVYEIIVEGGESRLMALFKGQTLDKIGPIRSSRHYFLDYALENDAIYVHYGWSPKAESDIKTLGVNNINGITEASSDFWRVKDKKAPHNVATSTENILKIAKQKGYRTTSEKSSSFKYVVDEVNLENGEGADTVTIPYSTSNSVKWEYNSETKRYLRYTRNKKEVEWDSGEDVTFKNIIIEFIANSNLNDGTNAGRQDMTTTGTKDGYYITNGKAIKIKCTKSSRSGKTTYTDLEGNEIEVNDGNTFIQICPINANVQFTVANSEVAQ